MLGRQTIKMSVKEFLQSDFFSRKHKKCWKWNGCIPGYLSHHSTRSPGCKLVHIHSENLIKTHCRVVSQNSLCLSILCLLIEYFKLTLRFIALS